MIHELIPIIGMEQALILAGLPMNILNLTICTKKI